MDTCYLFIEELAFISDRLRQVFERCANDAADISFKDVQRFQKQIRTWDRNFIKPPMALVKTCDQEMLTHFYQRKLDFSIFRGFNSADLAIIQEEISAYAAREALDAFIGYRLRNWAEIGLQHPKWEIYQTLVDAYYTQTVPSEKREQIAAFERALAQTTGLTPAEIHAKCVGELFFEVDEIRLMGIGRLERHLERIRREATGQRLRKEPEHQLLNVPDTLQASFQLFGFTHPIDFDTLKNRYRQLALYHHPDKGGSLEMMQRLNAAYRQIADYLRRAEIS